MHAVITDVTVHDPEEAQKALTGTVLPMVSQAPGFVSGVWIAAGGDKGHSVVVFESEEAAKSVAGAVRAGAPSAVTVDSVEVHPVVAHA